MRGRITVEAGMTLRELMSLTVPRGFAPYVVPGTGQVTIGGAVANDVHGKNHPWVGSFGHHVEEIRLVRSDHDEDLVLRRGDPLFFATIGGLGLTGAMLDVTLKLQRIGSSRMDVENLALQGPQGFEALAAGSRDFTHLTAWLDLSGKRQQGVFSRARWREDGQLGASAQHSLSVPFQLPASVVTRQTTRVFNQAYRSHMLHGAQIAPAHYAKALWPLDGLKNWNRLHGPSGFQQYQVVTPSIEPMVEICRIASASGLATPLTVLKAFGQQPGLGWLSFPRPGFTLAIDFMNTPSLPAIIEALDEVVRDACGAWYPAKCRAISAADFLAAFPRWPDLMAVRDPAATSAFLKRMSP